MLYGPYNLFSCKNRKFLYQKSKRILILLRDFNVYVIYLQGGGLLYDLSKKAMITKNYTELDEAIRSKIRPYLYNNGDGAWIHCAHLACLRNRYFY